MVDNKKVAAGVAAVAIVGTAAVLALRGAEEPPVEEGAPQGEVSIEITPLGMPEGYSFEDVQGLLEEGWGEDATIHVNGKCLSGFPVPSMRIELWDGPSTAGATLRSFLEVPSATIGTTFTLTEVISGVPETGVHVVYGKMSLTNEIGTIDYRSTEPDLTFEIGVTAPGEITIDVTLA